jgi:hypothetical protein
MDEMSVQLDDEMDEMPVWLDDGTASGRLPTSFTIY